MILFLIINYFQSIDSGQQTLTSGHLSQICKQGIFGWPTGWCRLFRSSWSPVQSWLPRMTEVLSDQCWNWKAKRQLQIKIDCGKCKVSSIWKTSFLLLAVAGFDDFCWYPHFSNKSSTFHFIKRKQKEAAQPLSFKNRGRSFLCHSFFLCSLFWQLRWATRKNFRQLKQWYFQLLLREALNGAYSYSLHCHFELDPRHVQLELLLLNILYFTKFLLFLMLVMLGHWCVK